MKKSERDHMSRVADLGCLICHGPAEVHHIRATAGMGQRAAYNETIPLCPAHHRTGGYGVAIHAGKEEWEKCHGTEIDLLSETRRILAALAANTHGGMGRYRP